MGVKNFIADILKRVIANVITVLIIILGVYLIVRWIFGSLF